MVFAEQQGFDPARLGSRPIEPTDLPFLEALYASTRQEEMGPVPWSEDQKRAFLSSQFALQHRFYQENYKDTSFDVILVDGEPAGRLYVDRSPRELCVVDIALVPEWRGRGIGTYLMSALLDEARAAGQPVTLHVEDDNPAQHLYARLGFHVAGRNGPYQFLRWSPAAAS
jgi:ribosomal protein S18 acetylase RimI-like enzyme